MRHTMLGVIWDSKSSEGQRFGFSWENILNIPWTDLNPPEKKKKNRMQSSPLNQDDDIRSKQLGYIGNPNYYSRLIWVTGHPGSGVSNQHPKSNLKTHKLRPHQGFRGEFCPLEMFKSGTNPTHLRWPHLHLAGPADVRHGWRLVLHADMPCCDLLE